IAVTFPFTLLLLDYWPLCRWPSQSWRSLFHEKIPLFVLVGLHSFITFLVQHNTGATHYGERFSVAARIGNAAISYWRYLGKMIWPQTLSPLYFHPGHWPFWLVASALIALAIISSLVWLLRRA